MDIATSTAVTPHIRSVPLDQVHDDGDDMRRTKASARADAALTSSIRRRGVLQPIGVRPNGNGYKIVFGRRRLRCALAAELAEIPVDIRDWRDDEIRAVQGAENMQRRTPHMIDVWLTVRDLVDLGYSILEAAEELGLDERTGRQMERLGRLTPELLRLIEIEFPNDQTLRTIANAPPAVQKAATKGKLVATTPDGREFVQWRDITERCGVKRIPATVAIFDKQAHPGLWEEDLFAQPDDPARIGTRDIAKFMKLQEAALKARVEAALAAKQRVRLAEYSASAGWPGVVLPKGWKSVSGRPPEHGFKPRKIECVFTALHPDGTVLEVLAVDVAAKKAAETAAAERQKAKAAQRPGGGDEGDDAAGDSDADGEGANDFPAEVSAAPGITKAGLDLVAAAKTAALHKAIGEITKLSSPLAILLRLALLTFDGDNVTVRADGIDYEDVLAHLVSPDGQPIDLERAEFTRLAADALIMILRVGGPGTHGMMASGDAAEWIGVTIDAGRHLGRFDTAEFLKHVRGDVLTGLAEAAGIKSSGTVTALRQRLVGNLPDWRPDAAQFGAPGPSRER